MAVKFDSRQKLRKASSVTWIAAVDPHRQLSVAVERAQFASRLKT
jgi:hypothetical protein